MQAKNSKCITRIVNDRKSTENKQKLTINSRKTTKNGRRMTGNDHKRTENLIE